jgi:hypothetical protein
LADCAMVCGLVSARMLLCACAHLMVLLSHLTYRKESS